MGLSSAADLGTPAGSCADWKRGECYETLPSKQAEFEDVLATVRSGRRYPIVETYRQRKDGTLADVEIAAAPVRDSSGKVVSHMVVFTDITKRKRQERELRASRARIVEAAVAERRRLERNLHDGAQQRLVGSR